MKDYLCYQNKVCVVTGAASGMGKATCEILLDLGAVVYAMDVAPVTLPVQKSISVNIADKASIDAAFAEIPEKIDCFFGIAGVSGVKTDFRTTCMINFIGHKYMTETYLLPRMSEGGAIAYMGSRGGKCWRPTVEEYRAIVEAKSWDDSVAELEKAVHLAEKRGYGEREGLRGYYFSKRMMNFYVKYLTRDLMYRGIRINIICPGTTQLVFSSSLNSLILPERRFLCYKHLFASIPFVSLPRNSSSPGSIKPQAARFAAPIAETGQSCPA